MHVYACACECGRAGSQRYVRISAYIYWEGRDLRVLKMTNARVCPQNTPEVSGYSRIAD